MELLLRLEETGGWGKSHNEDLILKKVMMKMPYFLYDTIFCYRLVNNISCA
jgi:hypothetical protein